MPAHAPTRILCTYLMVGCCGAEAEPRPKWKAPGRTGLVDHAARKNRTLAMRSLQQGSLVSNPLTLQHRSLMERGLDCAPVAIANHQPSGCSSRPPLAAAQPSLDPIAREAQTSAGSDEIESSTFRRRSGFRRERDARRATRSCARSTSDAIGRPSVCTDGSTNTSARDQLREWSAYGGILTDVCRPLRDARQGRADEGDVSYSRSAATRTPSSTSSASDARSGRCSLLLFQRPSALR